MGNSLLFTSLFGSTHLFHPLQIYLFDVNKDRNKEGDLLIHVAVKGGGWVWLVGVARVEFMTC